MTDTRRFTIVEPIEDDAAHDDPYDLSAPPEQEMPPDSYWEELAAKNEAHRAWRNGYGPAPWKKPDPTKAELETMAETHRKRVETLPPPDPGPDPYEELYKELVVEMDAMSRQVAAAERGVAALSARLAVVEKASTSRDTASTKPARTPSKRMGAGMRTILKTIATSVGTEIGKLEKRLDAIETRLGGFPRRTYDE